MKLIIRPESLKDYRKVELMTREAFWGFTNPTCDEHYLVHLLRNSDAFIPQLDLVAELGNEIVGNVIYTRAKVVDDEGYEHKVLTFGPLSVLPSFWNKGIGTALMLHSIEKARQMGFSGIVFYGHPDYYPRFGFTNAKEYKITSDDGKNYDALMAMPLYNGAFDKVSGKFHIDNVFNIDAEQAGEYNRKFPHKEPARMIPIDVLLERLPEKAKRAFTDRNITSLAWLNRISGRDMICWDGIDEDVMRIVNKTLKEYGYSGKLLPGSEILTRWKRIYDNI